MQLATAPSFIGVHAVKQELCSKFWLEYRELFIHAVYSEQLYSIEFYWRL